MSKIKINKLGILGGSFDPPHDGHIKISIEARKLYKLDNIIWAITNKNPLPLYSKGFQGYAPLQKPTSSFGLKGLNSSGKRVIESLEDWQKIIYFT